MSALQCPVCLSIDGFELDRPATSVGGLNYFDCPVCGMFGADRETIDDYLRVDIIKATRRIRSTLSYWLRLNKSKSRQTTMLTSEVIEAAYSGSVALPPPAQVALAIIRFIGDHSLKTGLKIGPFPPDFVPSVGAVSREASMDILEQLGAKGLIRYDTLNSHLAIGVDLSLEGWEAYNAEQEGKRSGGYGSLAMKFGDPSLEALTRDFLKPAIKSLGLELFDMRDVAAPGIIDNIMRMRIRDAAFVIVDLTHDNAGAYWEAGYAEGLGKPVLYICEQSKFEQKQTHFDTNHCTTVMWTDTDPDAFCNQLVATLRRALPSSK